MSDASPVQPLESAGGSTDPRLANMLAGAKANTSTPQGAQAATNVAKVPGKFCPNCYVGAGKEVELTPDENAQEGAVLSLTGSCGECGYSAQSRTMP